MKKANRGDAINIPANNWNRLCDLAGTNLSQSPGNRNQIGPEFVYVKNSLGRDLSRFSAVVIGFAPDLLTGANDPVLPLVNGSLAAQQGTLARYEPMVGILTEPLANGRTGLAQISGVTPARVRFDEANIGNAGAPTDFATMADTDDTLAFSAFGPFRVLNRFSVNSTTGAKYWLVKFGEPSNLGTAQLYYSATGGWSATPNNNYGDVFTLITGDLVRLGVYGSSENGGGGPVGNLKLGRIGRYAVTVDWNASGTGYSAGDRLEWRATWSALNDPGYSQGASDYGSFTPSVWGGATQAFGQRTFFYSLFNGSPTFDIPLPGIELKKITTGGTVSSVSATGGGRIWITRLGSSGGPFTSFWAKAKRDAAWTRGSTAGPI